MSKQEINLEVIDEVKPLNFEEQQEDQKKNSSSSTPKVSFLSRIFFLWTIDTMKLSNKGQLKKDVIRKSTLFTSSKNKEQLHSDFIFLKQIWEGTDSKPGYKRFNTAPLILTIARFNFLKFLGIISLSFIVQGFKMGLVYYKRKIIKLFFNREQNKIEEYSAGKFRYLLYNNISIFLLIEATRFILNHQLKYNQRKITRKTNCLLSLMIYDKFMIQKLLETDMKEGDLINYFQTDIESIDTFFQQISKIIVFPFQFFTYFIILYKIFDKALFVGIFVLSIIVIVSIIVQKKYIKNQFDFLREKDDHKDFCEVLIDNDITVQIIKLENYLISQTQFKNKNKELYNSLLDLIYNLIENESAYIIGKLSRDNNCISLLFKLQKIPFYGKENKIIKIFNVLISSNHKYIPTLLISEGICELYKNILENEPNSDDVATIINNLISMVNYTNNFVTEKSEGKDGVNLVLMHLEKIGFYEVLNNLKSRNDLSDDAISAINEISSLFNHN